MAGKMAEIGKWAVFCLLTGLALLLAGPVLLGLRPRIVVSGSMEPAVPVEVWLTFVLPGMRKPSGRGMLSSIRQERP